MPRDKVYPYDDADTKLVSIKNAGLDDVDVYIGHENKAKNLPDSVFRNPFDKTVKGYLSAREHYKLYFYRLYLTDESFRRETHKLFGKTLGGWCYPKPSHGEVIVDLLESMDNKEDIESSIQHIKSEFEQIDKSELGTKGFREYNALEEVIEKL